MEKTDQTLPDQTFGIRGQFGVCDKCLVSFNVSDGHIVHLQTCPAKSVSSYRKYLMDNLRTDKVFDCKACSYERRRDLELWEEYQDESRCVQCAAHLKKDITLHVHSARGGSVMCGFCTQEVPPEKMQDHIMKHYRLLSILFKICSKECLERQFEGANSFKNIKNRFTCCVCMNSIRGQSHLRRHLSNHGIYNNNIKPTFACPLCSWNGKRSLFGDHLKRLHGAPNMPPKLFGEGVTCGHCFLLFKNKDELAAHIGIVHMELGDTSPAPFSSFSHGWGSAGDIPAIADVDGTSMVLQSKPGLNYLKNQCVTCAHCARPFGDLEKLSSHIFTEHLESDTVSKRKARKLVKCCLCCLRITKSYFSQHLREIHGYYCRTYPSSWKSKRSLHHYISLADFRRKLTEDFTPGKIFGCKCCHLPRLLELEGRSFSEDRTVDCANCRTSFTADLSCHLHKKGEAIVCGFCSEQGVLNPEDVASHLSGHQRELSYLINICSSQCLVAAQKTWPKEWEDCRDLYKCMTCFKGFRAWWELQIHTNSHKPKCEWVACAHCNLLLPGPKQLRRHIYVRHSVSYSCPLCPTNFNRLYQFKSHLGSRHHGSTLQCLQCSDVYSSVSEYLEHLQIHASTVHICSVCNEKLSSIFALRQHEKLHGQMETCDVCLQDFPDKMSLTTHRTFCLPMYKCAHCFAEYRSLFELSQHIINHHFVLQYYLDNPYQCKECPKTFHASGAFFRHKYKFHAVPQEQMCPTCGKVKPTRGDLYRHVRYYHAPNVHQCVSCDKAFRLKHHLDQHVFYNHTTDFPFECSKCGNRFRRAANLKHHEAKTCTILNKSKK